MSDYVWFTRRIHDSVDSLRHLSEEFVDASELLLARFTKQQQRLGTEKRDPMEEVKNDHVMFSHYSVVTYGTMVETLIVSYCVVLLNVYAENDVPSFCFAVSMLSCLGRRPRNSFASRLAGNKSLLFSKTALIAKAYEWNLMEIVVEENKLWSVTMYSPICIVIT